MPKIIHYQKTTQFEKKKKYSKSFYFHLNKNVIQLKLYRKNTLTKTIERNSFLSSLYIVYVYSNVVCTMYVCMCEMCLIFGVK